MLFLIFLTIAILAGVRWYLVVLICISLMIKNFEHLFMSWLAICMFSVEKMPVQVLCPFLVRLFAFVILNCMISLYTLDMNFLLDILFTNIFSHSVGWLFILLMISLAIQKLLSLIRSHLFIFVPVPYCFDYCSFVV